MLSTPHSLSTGLLLITPFLSNPVTFTRGIFIILYVFLLVKKIKLEISDNRKKCIKWSLRAVFHHSTQVINCTAILTCWMSPSRALLQRVLNVCLIGFMLISFRINIKLRQMVSVHSCLSCQSPESLVSRKKGQEENLSGFRQSLKLTLAKGI